MTFSDYLAKVTEYLISLRGPNFQFPDWFETDVETYYMSGLIVERAAVRILVDME